MPRRFFKAPGNPRAPSAKGRGGEEKQAPASVPGRERRSSSRERGARDFLPAPLGQVLARIRAEFGESRSLITRTFAAGPEDRWRAAVAYIDGLVNREEVHHHILKALMFDAELEVPRPGGLPSIEEIAARLVSASEIQIQYEWEPVLMGIAAGSTALFVDGVRGAVVVSTPGWERRGVDEPVTESVVRGPREGFTETLRTNETLLRRRIKSPRLRFRELVLGRLSRTNASVVYIEGLAEPSMVEEVFQRLSRVDIDAVLESGSLEEYIQDSPFALFPQTLRTERPDVVAANLLEGRVAVLTDNTPFALVVPVVFAQFLASPEDYYERYLPGSLIRMLRYVAFTVSLTLPAFYVAITTFHQELLPTALILALAAARQGVPFPAVVEALLMEVLFEILREAGIRLPRVVGQAVSIVGALVVGEAAVSASLVSPAMVIVVAMTAIASFATPVFSFALTVRILRFAFVVSAATIGLFGIQLMGLLLLIRLVGLRSFGVPYLAPFAPLRIRDLKDSIVRVPLWAMRTRPSFIPNQDRVRQEGDLQPRPPRENEERDGWKSRDRRRGARRP